MTTPTTTSRPTRTGSTLREPGVASFAFAHLVCCGGVLFVAAGGAGLLSSVTVGTWSGIIVVIAAVGLALVARRRPRRH